MFEILLSITVNRNYFLDLSMTGKKKNCTEQGIIFLLKLISNFSRWINISNEILYTSMEENCYTKDILYSSHMQKCIANCDAIPGKLFPAEPMGLNGWRVQCMYADLGSS